MKYVGKVNLWNRYQWRFIRYPHNWLRLRKQVDVANDRMRWRLWTLTIAGFTWFFDDVRDAA